nr:MAG TPA: hypothetical protein [Caudoviricetes sp.]
MPRVQMVLCKNHQGFYRLYVLLFEIPPNRYEVWQTGKHQKKEEL